MCLTQESTSSEADVWHRLLQELCHDHVHILVLLFPPRAQETQVFAALQPRLLHTSPQTVGCNHKVVGRMEEL